ncbi:GT4 family glycosyltransferase PelF [Streptomyces sp. NPDC051940]|uniref:GT4 family glycosyltransferase PelF n=1 Tax=Streptomyces sp. NPDC051940 TaxID=3155675 RepID=UPI00344709F7
MFTSLEALRHCADRITLLTEGTYPHSQGGVSVWCDQLVRAMPEFDFRILALTGTGREPRSWQPPATLGEVTTLPLWGPPPAGRAPRGRERREFLADYEGFLTALTDPWEEERFAPGLYALAEWGRRGRLSAALRSEPAVRLLHRVWTAPGLPTAAAGPSLHDALQAADLLEHALRPLHAPLPRTGLTHAVSGGLAALPGLAARAFHDVPLLLTEHGLYLRERYLGYRAGTYRWPVKALLLGFFRLLTRETYRAAALVTPGSDYNRRWEEHGGAARIRTVYNGVDPQAFPFAGPEPAEPTLVWAGRIDPIKDLETLIRAFALVRAEIPEARLRVFGGTAADAAGYRRRCVGLAAELCGEEGDPVVFEGRVPDIRDAYAAGNVVMLSSISEGFPFTLIEAMSCGRATVSTDVGGVREAAGDAGLVVQPRAPQAMARAALELLRDPDRRAAMGEAARLRVIDQFTLRQTIDTFRGIYLELLDLKRTHDAMPAPDGKGGAVMTSVQGGRR